MKEDAFSKRHPSVSFVFFVAAICFGALFHHPAYLAAGIVSAGLYYVLLNGRKSAPAFIKLFLLFAFITLINPLFNTRGDTVLATVFGRPYTLEALIYGSSIASVFVITMLWFGCWNRVMTGDKFTCLFGNAAPALSILLVTVFRMVPEMIRRAKHIIIARNSIGKGGVSSGFRERVKSGAASLGALASLSLEGSVTAGDSMRSRGYGTAKRTSFSIFRMKKSDVLLLVLIAAGASAIVASALLGAANAEFLPKREFAPVTGAAAAGFAAYCLFLLIPSVMHIWEVISWNISRSGI